MGEDKQNFNTQQATYNHLSINTLRMNLGEAARSDFIFTPIHSGSPHVWAPHEGVKAG